MAAANTDRFKKAKRQFSTTIAAGGFTAGATTLPLTSTSGLDTDTAITLVISPGEATEEVITGVVSGSNVINCVRGKEGTTDQNHSAGDAVAMYFTETHWDDLIDGILAEHKQTGAHSTITADSITTSALTVTGTATTQGWTALGQTPNTVTANGNRNYDLVFNGVDLSGTLSPGMKLQLARTVAAPDQCADLESGSSQYFTKASPSGVTFTDDWTAMAWVKLESYTGSRQVIINRSDYNTNGFGLAIDSSGRLEAASFRIAANNSVTFSYQSIPLNKWVHVAATTDLSGASVLLYIDGALVASSTTITGTITALTQYSGDLRVGALSSPASQYFDGKLAQVAVFSSVLSASTIRSYMSQGLSGAESTLVSAYSLDNSLNDLSANANNLTASGGAAATATDSPFANAVSAGTLEYAEVNSVAFSTNTTVNVRVPDTCMIPTSGGVSSVNYSTQSNPYGLPYFSKVLGLVYRMYSDTTGGTAEADVNGMSTTVYVPTNAAIKLTAFANTYNTTGAAYTVVNIKESTTFLQKLSASTAGANSPTNASGSVTIYPTAGSHTYKLSYSASGGNKALEASTTEPIILQVELV